MIRMFVVIVFLLHLKCMKGDMVYYLEDRAASWRNAASYCTLATPRTNYINGEVVAEIGNADLGLEEGDEAWVGYSLEPVILQSIGCMKFDINQEPDLAPYINTGADPGRCFSACLEQGYIGLMDTKCFCLGTLTTDNIYKTECTKACSGVDNQAACGGDKFVSIYTQAKNITPSKVDDYANDGLDRNCIAYTKKNGSYHQNVCSNRLRIGCQNSSGSSVDIGSRTVTWLQMTQFCFSQNLLTYDHQGALADNGTYATMWTGMVKVKNMIKNRQWIDYQTKYAYIKRQNGFFIIHFTTGLSLEEKGFLCQTGSTTMTPTTNTGTPTITDTHVSPEVEPEPEVKVTSEPEPEPVAEGSVSTLLPLFIIIPLVLIVLAIVLILLVLRWRRRKRNDQLKEDTKMKNSKHDTEESKRNSSLSEKKRLPHDNVAMYDIMKNGTNGIKNDEPTNDQKLVLDPNFSNNLHATLPLDSAPMIGHESTDADRTDDAPRNSKSDNEYARINKARKVTTPKVPDETYDKLNNEKKRNDNRNYDKVNGDDMYDTTVKPKTVPTTNGFYDGLSKF